MKILFTTITLIFSCFFHIISFTQSSKLLLGTVSYTGQSRCRCVEDSKKPNQYDLTITNAICTKETELSMKESLQNILPNAKIAIQKDQNNLLIQITYDPKKIILKLEERETIDRQKKFSICIYDKQQIRRLKKMAKKPILQYTYNQNILSVIA